MLRFIEEWTAGERPTSEEFAARYPELCRTDPHLLADLRWAERSLREKLYRG
jgi:hypothetical protein